MVAFGTTALNLHIKIQCVNWMYRISASFSRSHRFEYRP